MKRRLFMRSALLFAASAALLLASTVGSTRAALTYYSDYELQVTVPSIGISLLENEKVVSHRNYVDDHWSSDGTGSLLSGILEEGETLKPGKRYAEELRVSNSGSIDTYVRVILCRSWKDANGNKDTTLTPALIGLELKDGDGWMMDETASTPERIVLYYVRPLAPGESTPTFCDAVRIDPMIATKVIKNKTTDANGNKVITTSCAYDGYQFSLEAEVDAVQTHSAAEAVKSAWGIDVAVAEDGSLSLQ